MSSFHKYPVPGSVFWRRAVANVAALPTGSVVGELRFVIAVNSIYSWNGSSWAYLAMIGSVGGPASNTDNTIARFDGVDSHKIQDSLVSIDDSGSVNIPSGQYYKINNVNLSYSDVGAQVAGNYITSLTGEATASGPGAASTTLDNAAVIGKLLTAFTPGAGTVAATDSILQAIQKLQGNFNIYENQITVLNPLLGTTTYFANINTALASIPAATTAAEARQSYVVYIPSGTYDYDVTVEINNRKIVIVCMGTVAIGTLTGSSWGSGGTPRNFTITNNGTSTINSIRSGICITNINSLVDGSTSNEAYLSKMRISGNLVLTSAVGISSEFHFEIEVFGNVIESGYAGNCNIYTRNSRYRGTFGTGVARLQSAMRTRFGGLVSVAVYSSIIDCYFEASLTTTIAAPEFQPSGMINTNFNGTFTGPATSARIDNNTNYWFTANGATLAGGATKVLLEAYASTTADGVLSSTDWNTFNNKQPAGSYEITTNKGAANGYAPLDAFQKVPIANLPSAIMEYKGAWSAATNTPTLANGTGDTGDVYRVSAAGSVDFGAGSITFVVGEFVIYNGSIWQQSPASDGVISVNGAQGVVTVNAINQLTSDVTTSAASGSQSLAATIANSAVTNAKMANMAALTIKGNATSGSAAPTDLAATEARQTTGSQTVFNGLEDATKFSVSYSAATRIFTVTYTTGAAYTVGGVRYTKAAGSEVTTAHANTSGGWFLYYNVAGVLTVSSAAWDLLTHAPLSFVYYNATAVAAISYDERHAGITGMDNAVHKNLHTTRGTQLLSGVLASGYTLNTNGLANTSYALSSGSLADEDLIVPVAAQAQGGANTYRILYKTGAAASPLWNWVDSAEGGIYSDGTNIYYNQNNAGTWQLTPVSSNAFVNYWVFSTTTAAGPQSMMIMGQTTYASQALAESAVFSTAVSDIGLFSQEGIVIYQMTYGRNGSYGAPGNIRLLAVTKITTSLSTVATGTGTVTSVALTDDTGLFTITGSPITNAGVLHLSAFASQTANTVLAAPDAAPGAPSFRALVSADVSFAELSANKSTSTSLGTSDTLYPSQNAVKTYVDNNAGGVSIQSKSTAFTAASKITYLVDTTGGAIAVQLPAPALNAIITIKDSGFVSLANNITLVRAAAEKIEGVAATYELNSNGGSWTVVSDGTDWYIL